MLIFGPKLPFSPILSIIRNFPYEPETLTFAHFLMPVTGYILGPGHHINFPQKSKIDT